MLICEEVELDALMATKWSFQARSDIVRYGGNTP